MPLFVQVVLVSFLVIGVGCFCFVLGEGKGQREEREKGEEAKKLYMLVLSFLTPEERGKIKLRIDATKAQKEKSE